MKSLQARHDDLVATNKSLAEYNLSLRPKLDDLKQHVAFQYQRVNDLKTSLAEGKAKLGMASLVTTVCIESDQRCIACLLSLCYQDMVGDIVKSRLES